MKVTVIHLLFFIFPLAVNGQYFQFTQYNFTDQRINPGMVASSDYASAAFIFRDQGTGGDFRLKSSMVSGAYPFLRKNGGGRWSGLGISLMDDRSGGIFTVQEASLSYAINVFLSRFQFLALGFKGLYQQRRVNLTGLYTGSQYIQDRGFDESLYNGEDFGLLRSDFTTFSTGLYWQQSDRLDRRIAYWGISIFDLNKPQDTFSGIDNQLHSTFVASGGVRIYEAESISIMPEFLLTYSSGKSVFSLGAVTSYEVKPYPNQIVGRIDLISKYVPGRSGILGLQFHREQFAVGFSYDFPVVKRNAGNTGAFEIALQARRLVDPVIKRRLPRRKKSDATARKIGQRSPVTASIRSAKAIVRKDSVTSDSSKHVSNTEPELLTSLRHKSDSVLASAKAGRVSHEPLVIERLTLHFNFEFNSSDLDAPSMKYLDDLTAALKENALMKVKLTGHTDNVGSPAFNMRLSLFRADVIRQYLIDRGVEPSRIESHGKGLTEPLNNNATEEERGLNRRVELLIYYQE